jgi:hypothetical protein
MTAFCKRPGGFTWGRLVKVHRIGDYQVVEFNPEKSEREPGEYPYEDTTEYHPYVAGVDTMWSFGSMDAALVGAIAYKNEGANSRAAQYFCKMVGIK